MEISNLTLDDEPTSTGEVGSSSLHKPTTTITKTTYLYTGSSYKSSAKIGNQAAVCVCFNEDKDFTITELLNETLTTNQRVELYAIQLALNVIKDESIVHIISKSTYAVNSVNNLWNKWKKNSQTLSSEKRIANNDLIEDTVALLQEVLETGKEVVIYHMSETPNKRGNSIAYRCARDHLLNIV